MPRRASPKTALTHLLDESSSPVYVMDGQGQIIYCNRAVAEWTGVAADKLIGRQVVYHSADEPNSLPGVAAGLCPPPDSLAGRVREGHVSCQTQEGRIVYRRGRFEPLADTDAALEPAGVLAVLSASDLPADEIAKQLAPDAESDLLHAAICRFRRLQAEQCDPAALVGVSNAMRTIRRQVEMAASTNGPVTIIGPPGSGRERIAKAIHYHPPYNANQQLKFAAYDGAALGQEELRWTIESMRDDTRASRIDTLLIRNVDLAEPSVQRQLLSLLSVGQGGPRVVVTASGDLRDRADADPFDVELATALAVLVIKLPPLHERREDLPLLAQFFVEERNRGSERQLGGLTREAVEMLALYTWPRGLDELREVIFAAHDQTTQSQITAADLPTVLHHAVAAAALPEREDEPIILDDFLSQIERELIERALRQTDGNKTRAAKLLGVNRPRFYRRLAQLGLD